MKRDFMRRGMEIWEDFWQTLEQMEKCIRGTLVNSRRRPTKVTTSENTRKTKGDKWQKNSRRQGIGLGQQ